MWSDSLSEEDAAEGSMIFTITPSRFKVPSPSPKCPSNLSIVSKISLLIDVEIVLMPL